jgi:type I restriction enzyme S subunit
MTDIELPKGWAVATLGEVCAQSGRKSSREETDCPPRFLGLDDIAPDEGRIISHHLSSEISGSGSAASSGDILYCRLRPYLNKVAVAEGDYLCSGELLVFCANDDITGSYVAHWLRSDAFVSFAIQNSKGDRPRVYWTEIAASSIPLPPGNEQRRIVNELERRLSHVDAAVAGLRSAVLRLTAARRSVLNATASGALLGLDSSEWQKTTTGEVSEVRGGIQKQPKRMPVENTRPFLRVANVGRGRLDLSEVHEIEVFDGEVVTYALKAGDLLVVEGNGSVDQIGRAASWDGSIEECVHQNHLIRVRPNDSLDPHFLALVWNAPSSIEQLKAIASSTSGLHTLSTGKIKNITLRLPNLNVQKQLVLEAERRLSLLDAAERAVTVSLTKAGQLRRSLLKDAFSGKLVPQDPNDEPADVLLARIRTQREADRMETKKKPRKTNVRKKKEPSL